MSAYFLKHHQNFKYLNQQTLTKESTLKNGLSRVDQDFEQWQKNQEAKRLQLEQQKLEQQRIEQANRKASQDLDRGGLSL